MDENEHIANLLVDLINSHKNWVFKLCLLYLRNVLRLPYNHKRVYRIYREFESNLRIKPKSRIKWDRLQKITVQSWGMDFIHDALTDSRVFRLFNVIYEFKREALTIKVDFSVPPQRIIRSLNQLI